MNICTCNKCGMPMVGRACHYCELFAKRAANRSLRAGHA